MRSMSAGKTHDMSVLTEVADLEAVIDYVVKLPHIDPSHLLLMGCSQGGLVSALTAAKRRKQITKLALFYPALCIPDDARSGKMMFARFDPCNVPQRVRCGPMKLGRRFVTDVLELDPFTAITPYPGPVLIVHGTKDPVVHPQYAHRAYAAYGGRPGGKNLVQLEMIEEGGHGFSRSGDAVAMEKLAQFASF